MKRIAIVGCVLVLMAAAFKAGDIVRAERFVVFNDRGKPAFVATVNQAGGGELAVYDALGNETFAVRDGKIIAPSLGPTAEIAPSQSEPKSQGGAERVFRTFWPPDDLLGQPHDPRTETAESARNRTLWEPEPQTGAAYRVGEEPRNHYSQGKQPPNIIVAERFTVFNDRGKPAVVATVDQSGAGVLVVYDALGNEVFAVRGGKVFAPSFKPAAATTPAQPKVTRDPVEERIRRAGKASRPVYQPDMLGKKPYLSIELLDWAERGVYNSKTRWRVVIRVTNISPYDLKSVTFQPEIAGEDVRNSRGARVALTASDLGRRDHDVLVFSYDHQDTKKGQPRSTRFRITSVSTKEGQSRTP